MNTSEAIDYNLLNRKSLLTEISSRDEKIVRANLLEMAFQEGGHLDSVAIEN